MGDKISYDYTCAERMVENMNLFENKEIRNIYDSGSQKHWFCVVDVCAALRDTDYKTARNYWKWYKNRINSKSGQRVTVTNQLKLPALDGKLRYTDVMDAEGVLRLIQMCPSPEAEKFKLWIADLINKGQSFAECLIKGTEKCVDKTVKAIRKAVKNPDTYCAFLLTITKKAFDVSEGFDEVRDGFTQEVADDYGVCFVNAA